MVMKTFAEGIIASSEKLLMSDKVESSDEEFESERGKRLTERRSKFTLRLVELLFEDELVKLVR
jgi:hypothetical protein